MTARRKNPMTKAQAGRLGGLSVSQDRDHMSRIGYRGAMANLEINGPDQPMRARLIALGHNIPSIAPSRSAKGSRASTSVLPSQSCNASTREPFAGRELDRDSATNAPGSYRQPATGGKEKGRTAANSPTNSHHGRF